jgi:predicted nucleotidyltransferase
MNRLEAALVGVVHDVAAAGKASSLVGGLAVSARSEPRFTRDLDLAVAVSTDAEGELLVRNLVEAGYRTIALVEHQATRRLATVRIVPPGGDASSIVVDLLFASSGIEAEIVGAAEPLAVFPGVVVQVAQVGHLVALKLLSRDDRVRPQDAVDLGALRRVVDPREIDRAREAVAMIEQRGFARGRDLRRALDAWVEDA